MSQDVKYEIFVERGLVTGRLTFQHGQVSIDTKCYWDFSLVMDAGDYVCCRTMMAAKQRPAIWFGKGMTYNKGTVVGDGAFIHKYKNGDSPWGWSTGCIVIVDDQMTKLLNAIPETNVWNIRVVVKDKKYYIPALNR